MFVVHHESEDGASGAAAETVIGLALGIHVEGGRFSRWNGQSARQLVPARLRGKYELMTSTMSLASATRWIVSSEMRATMIQITLRPNLARGDSARDKFSSGFRDSCIDALARALQSQEIRKGSVVVVPLSGEVTEARSFPRRPEEV